MILMFDLLVCSVVQLLDEVNSVLVIFSQRQILK